MIFSFIRLDFVPFIQKMCVFFYKPANVCLIIFYKPVKMKIYRYHFYIYWVGVYFDFHMGHIKEGTALVQLCLVVQWSQWHSENQPRLFDFQRGFWFFGLIFFLLSNYLLVWIPWRRVCGWRIPWQAGSVYFTILC